MSRTRSQTDAALESLYARIPAIPDCDGRCWTSCGPIDMSWRERSRIRAAGVTITPFQEAKDHLETFWCEALTSGKRCAIYEMRPLICRLWGAAEGLECPFGCVPEGGWLSREEGLRLIAESKWVGGHEHAFDPARLDEGLARPELQEELERLRVRGQAGDSRRANLVIPAAFRAAPD
jgi:Fe-S-cluster containining protein